MEMTLRFRFAAIKASSAHEDVFGSRSTRRYWNAVFFQAFNVHLNRVEHVGLRLFEGCAGRHTSSEIGRVGGIALTGLFDYDEKTMTPHFCYLTSDSSRLR